MSLPVKLSDVMEGFELAADFVTYHLNRRTGEVVMVMNRVITGDDVPGPTLDDVSSEDFIPLPSKFDINEWAIMERFAESLDNSDLREDLLDTIRGSGAFRRFKSFTIRHGLRDAWHKFRAAALREIAIEFLEENQIPFTED